ncbi:MAG: CoA ester lyase [Pseudomonadota bacterium]
MSLDDRPVRSVLYIPGSKARALDKAAGLPTDAIIFDLEDAVAPDEKAAARAMLGERLVENAYGRRLTLLRVNGRDTDWGAEDLTVSKTMAIDGVLLPKVDGPDDLEAARAISGDARFWAMIETARGVINAMAIADHPLMDGFVLGTNDLAKELGCRTTADRAPLMASLQQALLAARAAGILCVDGVFNAFRDEDGFRRECKAGRDLGMDGKTLIHPAQVEIANEVFAPGAADIDLAERMIAAHEAALAEGQGVAVLDGRIVENLHVDTARRVLAKASAIAAMAEEP